MIALPELHALYYHRDYDGLVAAAMVYATTTESALALHSVQYKAGLDWPRQSLGPAFGIVDFLFHPAAALWVDHHSTTFASDTERASFRPDAFHIFEPDAPSCPGVIVEQPWFAREPHWEEYVKWANVIDDAAYDSPAQANDLTNPHILLSHMIGETADDERLASIVRAIPRMAAQKVVKLGELVSIREKVLLDAAWMRANLGRLLALRGQVAMLDQASLHTPYRRYLPYERYPESRYGVGLYRSEDGVIVSVGENPWSTPGPVHLGELSREFGGGGRRSTAGIPTHSVEQARELAEMLVDRLNDALKTEGRDS